MSGQSWDKARYVDHIEVDHERELAPGTTWSQMRAMHAAMHAAGNGEQWGHSHVTRKEVGA